MWCSEGVGRIQASTKALLEINLVYSHLPYTAEQQMVHKCLPHGDKRHGRNVAPKKPGAQEHTLHQTMKGKGRRDTSAVRHPGTGGLGGTGNNLFLVQGDGYMDVFKLGKIHLRRGYTFQGVLQ